MKYSRNINFVGVIIFIKLNSCVSVKKDVQAKNGINTISEFRNQSREEIINEIEVYFKIIELGFREGRKLTSEEIKYANLLKIQDPEGIRVLEYDRIPLMLKRDIDYFTNKLRVDISSLDPGYGRAFPRTIMLRKSNPDKLTTLIHELVHVKQIQDLGYVNLVAQIYYEYETFGYDESPLEIEAEEKAYELQK